MINHFANKMTEDIFENIRSKDSRKFPQALWRSAQKKLTILDAAELLESLSEPPGNRLEALKGDRQGQHSIRINDQWRICFRWTDEGVEDVEIVDYH
jgi:proteic killer suppression protein